MHKPDDQELERARAAFLKAKVAFESAEVIWAAVRGAYYKSQDAEENKKGRRYNDKTKSP